MANTLTILDTIPITWDGQYDCWNGVITLPAWSGYISSRAAYNSPDSDKPSDGTFDLRIQDQPAEPADALTQPILQALKHFIDNQAVIHDAIAARVIKYAKVERIDNDLIPAISKPEKLKKLIGPSILHVFYCDQDPTPCVGLELGCQWEEEHGLGVVTQNGKVLDIGHADIAFIGPSHDALDALENQAKAIQERKALKKHDDFRNDDTIYTLTLDKPLAPGTLKTALLIYCECISPDRTQITRLTGIEALVFSQALLALGYKSKITPKPKYDIPYLKLQLPLVTDWLLAAQLLTPGRSCLAATAAQCSFQRLASPKSYSARNYYILDTLAAYFPSPSKLAQAKQNTPE